MSGRWEEETQSLARAAGGDAARFAELYERIGPALHTWATLRIRPAMRVHVDPQDVVQEVWARAWKGFPGFDAETTSFRHWLFRIAKNVMLEAFRKVQRVGSGTGTPGPTTRLFQLQNVPESVTAVSQRVARDEGVRKLIEWVEQLDEEEQTLFVHCGLEGLTYAEVGERMQIHKETIAKRWQNLRARIAQFALPAEWMLEGV